jgi:hypothetical protein
MQMPVPTCQSSTGMEIFMKKIIANSPSNKKPFEPEISEDGRHADDMTILRSRRNFRQTKLIRRNGPSGSAIPETHFTHLYVRAASLNDIKNILCQLAKGASCFVIRGRAKDEAGEVHLRRWAGTDATLEDVKRNCLMIDIDKPVCDVPDDWQDNPKALVMEIIKKALPDEFHNAGVVWQWSSSMGIKKGVPKVHLWFRLNEPIDSKTAKRWLSAWSMYHDESVLQTGQPHFTATPVFEGMDDPVRERIGMIDGPDVIVPPIPERGIFPNFIGDSRIVGKGYEFYRDQIGIQDFHMSMRSAVGSYISTNWPDPDVEWLRGDLRQHILTCEASHRTMDERKHRAGDHLDKLIEWTLQMQRERTELEQREITEFENAMRAEIEADAKRPCGRDLQRQFFDGLR